MIFSEDSTARAIDVARADPATVAAATPAADWLRNFRRVNWLDGEVLFIEKESLAILRSSRSSELRRIMWTPGSCFEYYTRRNCPREEVRLVSSHFRL